MCAGGVLIKLVSSIIALLGFWEAADIVALFVPGFGKIPAFLWNHILIGVILMVVGIQAAWTGNAFIVKTMHWIAAAVSLWLIISSFILRELILTTGFLNDVIVGVVVLILSVWTAVALPG